MAFSELSGMKRHTRQARPGAYSLDILVKSKSAATCLLRNYDWLLQSLSRLIWTARAASEAPASKFLGRSP